jgi:hypothetical protein
MFTIIIKFIKTIFKIDITCIIIIESALLESNNIKLCDINTNYNIYHTLLEAHSSATYNCQLNCDVRNWHGKTA